MPRCLASSAGVGIEPCARATSPATLIHAVSRAGAISRDLARAFKSENAKPTPSGTIVKNAASAQARPTPNIKASSIKTALTNGVARPKKTAPAR